MSMEITAPLPFRMLPIKAIAAEAEISACECHRAGSPHLGEP